MVERNKWDEGRGVPQFDSVPIVLSPGCVDRQFSVIVVWGQELLYQGESPFKVLFYSSPQVRRSDWSSSGQHYWLQQCCGERSSVQLPLEELILSGADV